MTQETMLAYVNSMLENSKFLRRDVRALRFFMDPDDPLPVSTCGLFAGQIVEHFDEIEPEEWKNLSTMIEDGVMSSDEDVSTMIVTGLIESLINRAERIDGLWPRIRAALGPEARRFGDLYIEQF